MPPQVDQSLFANNAVASRAFSSPQFFITPQGNVNRIRDTRDVTAYAYPPSGISNRSKPASSATLPFYAYPFDTRSSATDTDASDNAAELNFEGFSSVSSNSVLASRTSSLRANLAPYTYLYRTVGEKRPVSFLFVSCLLVDNQHLCSPRSFLSSTCLVARGVGQRTSGICHSANC